MNVIYFNYTHFLLLRCNLIVLVGIRIRKTPCGFNICFLYAFFIVASFPYVISTNYFSVLVICVNVSRQHVLCAFSETETESRDAGAILYLPSKIYVLTVLL